MTKKTLFLAFGVLLLFSLNFASALLCQNNEGWYDDCEKPMIRYNEPKQYYDHRDYKFEGYDYAPKPIFKGSYGNYRYEKYLNGDDNPTHWFTSYGMDYGYSSYVFGGGFFYPYRSYGYGYGYSSPFFWSNYDYYPVDYGSYHFYKTPSGYYNTATSGYSSDSNCVFGCY